VFRSYDSGRAICSLSIHPDVKAMAHIIYAPSPTPSHPRRLTNLENGVVLEKPWRHWCSMGKGRLKIGTERLDTLKENCRFIYFCLFNPLKPSGHYMYHQFNTQQFYVLPTQLYLCVLCGSQNKQPLFPYTTLTDWFL